MITLTHVISLPSPLWRGVGGEAPFLFLTPSHHFPISDRHHGQDEEHRNQRTITDNSTHRHPKCAAAKNHRNHTHRGCCRCQENRTHTALSCHMDGILEREFLQLLHLCRIVEEDDAVSYQDTQSVRQTIMSKASLTFLKCHSSTKKMIMTDMTRAPAIWGPVSLSASY